MRITVPARPLATQTEASSTASPSGTVPDIDRVARRRRSTVSMRWMVLSPLLATHSPAGPAAIAYGPLPTSIVSDELVRSATLIRETVPSAKLVTHRSSR